MKRSQMLPELRGSDTRELRIRLQDLRKEVFDLRFRGAAEEVAKTSRFRQIRREIARIMTVIGERQRAEARPGDGSKQGSKQ